MFKGIGDLSKLGQMMSQAQEVGARIQEMQEQLKHQRATGRAPQYCRSDTQLQLLLVP